MLVHISVRRHLFYGNWKNYYFKSDYIFQCVFPTRNEWATETGSLETFDFRGWLSSLVRFENSAFVRAQICGASRRGHQEYMTCIVIK
jgi:hypothetical protein